MKSVLGSSESRSTSEFPTHQALHACAVEVRAPPLSPVALPALRLVQYPRRVPCRSKMLAISKKAPSKSEDNIWPGAGIQVSITTVASTFLRKEEAACQRGG